MIMNAVLPETMLPCRLKLEKPMDDAQFLRFSAENDPLRMEREPNGDILVMTPATTKIGLINERVSRALGNWAEEDGRGVTFDSSTGFKMPNKAIRSPDAAWVINERWTALEAEAENKIVSLCPNFVIELVSPGDRLPKARKKMAEWIANGAELAWLIEPRARRVTIYRPAEGTEVHESPSSVQGTGCVSGFCLVMERVWG
jgi:Uma2 family endonuclease